MILKESIAFFIREIASGLFPHFSGDILGEESGDHDEKEKKREKERG